MYDLSTQKLTELPSLKSNRSYHTSIVFNLQFLYIFGGVDAKEINGIERLNLNDRLKGWEAIKYTCQGIAQDCYLERPNLGVFRLDGTKLMIFGSKNSHSLIFNVKDNSVTSNTSKMYSGNTVGSRTLFYGRESLIFNGQCFIIDSMQNDIHYYNIVEDKWSIMTLTEVEHKGDATFFQTSIY